MFGISFEHILIIGVILLLVGPRRLPELGNTMGKAIKNFKDSFNGVEEANFKRVAEQKNQTNPTPMVEPASPESNSAKVASAKTEQTTKDQA